KEVGPRRCGEQRDDTAVRMADQVVTGLEELGDQVGVRREVDARDGRIGREARTLDEHELEPSRQCLLAPPGPPSPHDAAVDENTPLHNAILDGLRSCVLSAW